MLGLFMTASSGLDLGHPTLVAATFEVRSEEGIDDAFGLGFIHEPRWQRDDVRVVVCAGQGGHFRVPRQG